MNDPVLIFFIALAAFLSYQLFSVLGSRGGHEPKEGDRVASPDPAAEQARAAQQAEQTPQRPQEPLPAWASTVAEYYPGFDHKGFLEGAKSAYEMIVQSFARGDLGRIRNFVDPEVMKTFEVAVTGRQNAGQSMSVTFIGVEDAEVVSAEKRSEHIEIVVDFRSDQTRVVTDSDGTVIEGDPNRIDLVRDRWTFSRPLGSRDPNWTLTATDGAAA